MIALKNRILEGEAVNNKAAIRMNYLIPNQKFIILISLGTPRDLLLVLG